MSKILVRLLMDDSQFDSKIKKAHGSTARFKKNCYMAQSVYDGFMKSLRNVAVFTGVSAAMSDVIRTSMEFEKSMSSLSALTGATGDDLEFLRIQAINLGATTTQTASQVADAFKLIGSQQPQLLKSKEALVAVTRSAIMLAEASESDVPTSAKALSGTLNQMGAGAERAEEFVNILAAASQQGSADIDYLNKAVEKSGGTANATGVKFNQLVAAIETIAPKVTEASEAGTQLRNIFLTLESSSDRNLKPSVVGLSGALETLAAKHYDAGQMAKLFGKENVNAALALTNGLSTYKELEVSITNTNTAQEQALTNTNNLAGSITKLQSAWEGFTLTLNTSNGILSKAVDFVTELVNGTRELLMNSEQLSAERVASGSSELINEAYANIRSSMDNDGLSRKEAYEKEIKRLEEQLKPIESNYINAEYEFNKHWNEGIKKGTIRKGVRGQWVEDTGGGFLNNGSILWASRNAALNDYKPYTDVKDERNSLVSALEALRQQAAMATETAVINGNGNGNGGGGGGVTIPQKSYGAGSLGAMEQELAVLRERLNSATSDEERYNAQIKIQQAVLDIDRAKDSAETAAQTSKEMLNYNPLSRVESSLDEADVWQVSDEELTAAVGMMNELKNNSKEFSVNMEGVFGALTGSALSGAIDGMVDKFTKGNDILSSMLSSIIKMGLQMAAMAVFNKLSGNSSSSGGGSMASNIMGSAMQGIVGSLIGGFFADGGIVGGQSYNDGVVARVSSGEMVINQADQRKLLETIKSGGDGGGTQTFRIDGESLYTVLSNYGRRTGRGALKFERR